MSKLLLTVLSCVLVIASSACGEVEHCKVANEPGCLNSPPREDGSCLYDLVRRGDLCVKPGSIEDTCSFCPEGTLCAPEEGKCVNFCEMPPVLAGSGTSPEPIFCRAFLDPAKPNENPMLSFEEVCKRRCRLECQRQQQYCGYVCDEGACDAPAVQEQCSKDCPLLPNGDRDLACLTKSCEDVRLARCDTGLSCRNGATVTCSDITCTNECQFADDGRCDDGDPVSSQWADCEWGSDCADCGPRKGPEPSSFFGGICAYNQNCAGGTGSPRDATAWCARNPLLTTAVVRQCIPDCSRGQDCEAGFECRVLAYDLDKDEATPPMPIVEDGLTSQGCFPLMCI